MCLLLSSSQLLLILCLGCIKSDGNAAFFFGGETTNRRYSILPFSLEKTFLCESRNENDEATDLLEKVARLRREIADLEGRSVEDVEQEASMKKVKEQERLQRLKLFKENVTVDDNIRSWDDGRFLTVPVTDDDMISQASKAVENAFQDGINRQVVRFGLTEKGESLRELSLWPGGVRQMYRESAKPLTRDLLSSVKAPTGNITVYNTPNITSKDIWDFDGSAMFEANAVTGHSDNVLAMVFPNTDIKYTNDIRRKHDEAGKRLFMLINPFWRNVDSWGFNVFAPNAKEDAQKVIFDRFVETYVLLRPTIRGEDCVAIKAYPYDWQLFAYREDDNWPYNENVIRLGSTKEEPTPSMFIEFLNEREEFKMNKNMRQMQRILNQNDE